MENVARLGIGGTWVLGLATAFAMGIPAAIGAQEKEPDSLNLLGKLRDFQEINPKGIGPVHPDFNSDIYIRYGGAGLVKKRIQDFGSGDQNVFPNDTRNPELIDTYAGTAAFHSKERFQEWYDDRAPQTYQRPFLLDMVFKRNAEGLYEFDKQAFFPLDENGGYRNLPGNDLKTFGVLNPCCNHNFGFTMEFHAWFTYLKGKGQVFNFRGDDDVWVFINDSLAIDLGGMHPARSGSVNLDQIADAYGLKDHRAYMLDFFIAERHVHASSCKITTSLVLGTRKVAEPVATPGTSAFNSRLAVSLATATPDAEIHYTLDGRNPDGNSPVYDPSKPFLFTGDATIKAIGMKPDWNPSEVMTAVYTKNRVPSVLEVLDGNGIPLAGRYLTGNDAGYQVRVTTTEAGASALTATATTKAGADRESPALPKGVFANDRFLFTAPAVFPFAAGKTAKAADGTTQSSLYDTLRVSWANPNLAGDSAFQSVPIRPAPRQARAWFSTRADGADTVDRFVGNETRIYMVVLDQPLPAGLVPSILVESAPRIGSGRIADKETLKLSTSPAAGKYVFAIDLTANPAAAAGDGKIQVALEDQIKATYSDPLDSEDPAVANAGFGIAPEIDAVVQFTDAAGAALPAGIKIDPATASLRLSYSDDWVNGQIGIKQAVVTVVNGGGRSPADSETFALTLNPVRRSGSTGVWTGVLPLRGSPAIARGNDTVDTYVLGLVTATVASHGKLGTAGGTVSDVVQVATPDQEAALSLEGPSSTGAVPVREDGGLRIRLKDQSLSSGRDTLRAELRCAESRDAVASVLLIETDPGTYVSALIPKAEGAAADDGILQCLPRDLIKATYLDPVYGTIREAEALLDNPIPMSIHFARDADGSDSIGAVQDGGDAWFYAIADAQSPSAGRTDTLQVVFTTAQGERETFPAVETGVYTHRFVAKIPYAFAYAVAHGNHVLEGRLDPRSGENRVTATASVSSRGSDAKAEILLASSYVPAARAWIQDRDGDGAADRVCVEFTKPLSRLPGSLAAQWNRGDAAFADAPSLSFLGDEGLIVAADYSRRPFPAGLTAIPSGQSPKARLPMDAVFQGQQPALEDSMGAVILAAEKSPHDLNALIPNDPSFYHDTLFVTVSEPIKAATDGRQMVKFAISCSEYDKAITVTAAAEPALLPGEPPRYRLIVDNAAGASPAAGNCVFLNADAGRFTDVPGNPLLRHGVELKGRNGDQVIQSMRGFPPVSGLDPNQGSWMAAVQDSRDADARPISISDGPGWQVLWVPPVGWQAGRSFEPYALPDFKDPRAESRETGTPIAMPADVSSIQVVSTSAYVAHITIFDNHGNLVSRSVQAFGGRGELKNLARATAKGMASWLVWDRKDIRGQKAGQGAYVWKVAFRFATGKNEIRYVRTGLLR